MTLVILFFAGYILGAVANVFVLLIACVVCAFVYLFYWIAMTGVAHPLLTMLIRVAALQAGYAVSMLAMAYLPSRNALGHRQREVRRRGAKSDVR
jgi:hypothetical protein